jgi:sphinganine-1-phosphate aldolase
MATQHEPVADPPPRPTAVSPSEAAGPALHRRSLRLLSVPRTWSHRYGYASKGASVCTFRDAALRRRTYVPCVDGCEGLYVTPTLQGSRSGATIAAAWATLVHMGEAGYREQARVITDAHETIKAAVRDTPGVRLCGDPTLAMVSVCGEDGLNVYVLATLLERRGWGLFTGQNPPTLGIPVGERTPHLLEALLSDLRGCVEHLRANPQTKAEGNPAVYGATATIPEPILEDVLRGYVDLKLRVKPRAPANGTEK